jgi:sugar-specific transcriptional regulator TrmB
MQKEEIINTLQKFGLTEYESKVYVTLSLLGPAKASEISKQSGVPQSKIYLTLESLTGKQFVEVSQERPKMFKAITPSFVIKNLLDAKEEEFKNLKQKAFLITRILRPIEVDEEMVEGVWVQKVERYIEILDRFVQMLKKAKNYVYDMTKILPYSSSYREALIECKKRGVNLHLMAMGLDDLEKVKWYLRNGIKVKFFEAKVHPRILVVDGREVAIRLDNEKFSFHSIWSQDPSFVCMVDNYLKSVWERARDVNLKNIPTINIHNS